MYSLMFVNLLASTIKFDQSHIWEWFWKKKQREREHMDWISYPPLYHPPPTNKNISFIPILGLYPCVVNWTFGNQIQSHPIKPFHWVRLSWVVCEFDFQTSQTQSIDLYTFGTGTSICYLKLFVVAIFWKEGPKSNCNGSLKITSPTKKFYKTMWDWILQKFCQVISFGCRVTDRQNLLAQLEYPLALVFLCIAFLNLRNRKQFPCF